MLCHIFFPEEPRRSSSWIFKSFTSCNQQSSTLSFCLQKYVLSPHNSLHNSGNLLWKKMSQFRINAEMLGGWKDVKRTIKACLTFLRSSKLNWLASHFAVKKTRELVAQKYYKDLQLFPIFTYCQKGTNYNSILIIVGWLTKMIYYKPVQWLYLGSPDLIVNDWDSVSISKSWSPWYHFWAWLR